MREKLPFDPAKLNTVLSSAKDIVAVDKNMHFNELREIIDTEFSSSGKMLRPILVLSSAEICGGWNECLIKAAALTELVHISSLIHDDIIDDSPLRRGRASVQTKYGKDMAVYAGDYILSRIMKELVTEAMHPIGKVFSKTMERMCIGELGQRAAQYNLSTEIDTYLSNISGKTAALFSAACQVGGIFSGANELQQNALKDFGEALGLLFQMRDDLIDIVPAMQHEGKTANSDFKNGIYTIPVLYTMKTAYAEKITALSSQEDADGKALYRLLLESGSIEWTIEQMHNYAGKAMSSLSIFDDSEAKSFLVSMPEKLLEFKIA